MGVRDLAGYFDDDDMVSVSMNGKKTYHIITEPLLFAHTFN